ncbi:MAG: type II toxin-antitoxin system HicA family toxin [Anaerolineae bacterium]
MKYRELIKKLRKLGCEFVRQAPGSHEIWWNPANRHFTSIPRHKGKDLPKGTVRAILRHLGIKPDEFRQA